MELEPNRKLFPDHLPSIFHGALVGAGSGLLDEGYALEFGTCWWLIWYTRWSTPSDGC
jgi:hypothetical protein